MTVATVLARLRGAPPRARTLGALAFLLLALCGALGFELSRDTRVALFATPLRADQLAEVEQRLAAWNVPYAAANDNVRVERAKRGELLLRLPLARGARPPPAGGGRSRAHRGAR